MQSPPPISVHPTAPASGQTRLIMRDLERAMTRLPYHQQTAIRLVGVDGHSFKKVAQLMDMSVPAVRCHLSRGRERLRELIEGPLYRFPTALSHAAASPCRPPLRQSG